MSSYFQRFCRILEEKDVNAGEIKTDGNKGWLSSSPLINNTVSIACLHYKIHLVKYLI